MLFGGSFSFETKKSLRLVESEKETKIKVWRNPTEEQINEAAEKMTEETRAEFLNIGLDESAFELIRGSILQGKIEFARSKANEIKGGRNKIAGTLLLSREKKRTEKQRKRAEIAEEKSLTDPLTGLKNRDGYEDAVNKEFSRADRHGTTFSLVMIDIDHFKRFNDEHGHVVGDEVLKLVAKYLKKIARESDTVARYGGEEFILILPETDYKGAEAFSKKLVKYVRDKSKKSSLPEVTISAGFAEFNQETEVKGEEERLTDEISLKVAADTALYNAKSPNQDEAHPGRDRAVGYQKGMTIPQKKDVDTKKGVA